jgi:hypothetical protein
VLTQILWWIGNALEILILARSIRGKFFRKYPTFYVYLSTVLLVDLVRFSVYIFRPRFHPIFYWYTEVLVALVGYAVILEIYKYSLDNSPGVARIARAFLWGVLGAVVLRVALHALARPVWSPAIAWTELERDLRTVQAVLLAGIVALLIYYVVPTGRNLIGIIFGYSAFIYASVISLAFGSLPGYGIRPAWRLVQPIVYLASLLIWVCTLWSYQPNPRVATESKIDRDYRLIAAQTSRALSKLRSFLKMGGEL